MHSPFTRQFFPLLFAMAALAIPMQPVQGEDLGDLLELRGYIRIGGTLEFSVHNKEEKRSEWLRVGERQRGYRIESYDPATNTITIHYNGKVGTLLLQASRIAEYVEPEPERDSAAGARPPPAVVVAEQTPGTSRAERPRPAAPPRSRQGSTQREERSATFMSRGSGPSAEHPQSPSTPSPENPGEGGNQPRDSYWAQFSSPPPLPSSSPPGYSPEE